MALKLCDGLRLGESAASAAPELATRVEEHAHRTQRAERIQTGMDSANSTSVRSIEPRVKRAGSRRQRRAARLVGPTLACGCAFALLLARASASAAAPAPGNPYVARFGAADLPGDAYNYGVAVDAAGEVLVANTAGLMRFAGGQWELVELPGHLEVRSIATTADGQIFLGSFDQFGRLHEDRFGTPRFAPLQDEFRRDREAGSISEVFRTASTRDGVYFIAYSEAFLLGADGARRRFSAGQRIVAAAHAGDTVLVQHERGPLTRLTPAGYVDVRGPADLGPDGPVFSAAVPAPDGRIYLLSRDRGWYRFDGESVERFEAPSSQRLGEARCFRAVSLPEGGYAVGCDSGEVFQLTPTLDVSHVHRVSELPISGLAIDREGFLWVATEGEMLRIALGSAWSLYDSSLGLRGTIQGSADLGDTTWVATTTGAYRSHTDGEGRLSFEHVDTGLAEVTDIQGTPFGILIAGGDGLVAWDEGRFERVLENVGVWSVEPASAEGDLFYAIEDERLAIVRHERAGWRVTDTSGGPPVGLSSLARGRDGELWAGQMRGGLIRFQLAADGARIASWEPRPLAGASPATPSTWVFQIGERVFARDADRYFVLDDGEFRRVRAGDGLPQTMLDELSGEALTCPDGRSFALTSTKLFTRAPNARDWSEVRPFDGAARRILGADCGAEHTLLIQSERGLLRFDPARPRAAVGRLVTRLRRAVVVRARSIDEPLALDSTEPLAIQPFRRMRFEYAVPTGELEVRYRTRLVGLDDDWTPATHEPDRELGALPPGDYRFEAIAMVAGAQEVQPATLAFRVLPRWYQRPAVAALALVPLGLLVAGVVRWRSAALLRANAALDALVRQRTRELEEANARLEQQARHDDLTGLANRRRLEHFGATAFADSIHLDRPLSLLMVDADHFKVLNDRLGHAAGDRRLREIAAVLRGHIEGAHELAARYGGEEFALVLPEVPLEAAHARAEIIRRAAAKLTDGVLSTVSIGVAERGAHGATSLEHLLRLADAALYRAKQRGRDRVAVAEAGLVDEPHTRETTATA
ncbi:MAG: diguanylate cyclase [bacterium]